MISNLTKELPPLKEDSTNYKENEAKKTQDQLTNKIKGNTK